MGRDLLYKLRAQITFDFDGTAALKLTGPEAKSLTLMVAQEEARLPYASEERLPSCDRIKAEGHPYQPKAVLHSPQSPGQNSKTL
jgi:hypothetical protein